jgi:hypothetical protein
MTSRVVAMKGTLDAYRYYSTDNDTDAIRHIRTIELCIFSTDMAHS